MGRIIGLLGGSFNPAHSGHIHISLEAIRRLRLSEVWWLVSPQNPLKSRDGMMAYDARIEAARSLVRHPRIKISDIEQQIGTRFTVDTLARLRKRYRTARFVWIIGADNLIEMPRWRRWRRIFQNVAVAVFDRGPYSHRALSGLAASMFRQARRATRTASTLAVCRPPAWCFFPLTRHPASATAIRAGKRTADRVRRSAR